MTRLLLRSAARFHRRAPLQLLLSVAGIALGVAVFVGVDVANTSATAAFESSADFVRGAATHRVLPLGDRLDESVYVELVTASGLTGAPIIEVPVTVGDARNAATLLGVDVIEEAAFRDATRPGLLGGTAPDSLISESATAIVAAALVGDSGAESIEIDVAGTRHTLHVAGRIPQDSGPAQLIVVDIATAQEVTGRLGELSRIDLILEPGQLERVRARLPPGTVVVPAGNDDSAFRQLSNAFRINVLALGLLALAIGMFLVYSSANFSLVRRTRSNAILRCVGLKRRELSLAIACEFLLLGLIASFIGVALGHALAKVLVDMMLFTIDDFAFRRQIAVSSASTWLYARGIVIGTAATLVAAFAPIRRAVQRDTAAALRRSNLEADARAQSTRGLAVAALCLLLAGVLLWWPSESLLVAFAGLFAVLAAAACATPACSALLVSGLSRVARHAPGFLAVQATRNVLAQQSRLAVATAALTLAVASVVGVGIMIGSFRSSLQSWLDTTLTSDIYVNLPEMQRSPDELIRTLSEDRRIEGISLTRIASVPAEIGPLRIRAFRPGTRGWGLQFVDGDARAAVAELEAGTAIALAEPFALRTGLTTGDSLIVPGTLGNRRFPIAGIFRNYDAGGAGVLLSLDAWRALGDEDPVDGIGIEAHDGVDIAELENDLRSVLRPGETRLTSSAGIRRISMEIFDRTFLITEVLRILAGTVAFLGMLSALMAVQMARHREFGILRALGFEPARLRRLIMSETAIIGMSAALLALPSGTALAALLVHVINVRSFGWTMELQVQSSAMIAGMALAFFAALLAGIVPAIFSHSRSVAASLQET